MGKETVVATEKLLRAIAAIHVLNTQGRSISESYGIKPVSKNELGTDPSIKPAPK